jgi:hypothetical protein
VSAVEAGRFVPDTEEGQVRAELRELDTAIARMVEQRAVLVGHLHEVEGASRAAARAAMEAENGKRAAAAQAEATHVAADRRQARAQMTHARGEAHRDVLVDDYALSEFKKSVGSGVACPNFESVEHISFFGDGDGFFPSRDNGRSTWCGLPRLLQERLVDTGRNTLGELKYVVGGPCGDYCARLQDGSEWWYHESERFNEILEATYDRDIIRSVAFGPDGSWIILFEDGKCQWRWIIPGRLAASIKGASYCADEVSLGSDETFLVRFADGDDDYCLPKYCVESCRDIVEQGYTFTNVVLASGDSDCGWLVRYSLD